jgi:hypothetical protein
MKYLLLILFFVSLQSYAEENLCGKIESKYRYPLAESIFTKENFELALASLKETDKANAYDYDFYDIESDLMYIKGYMLKLHIKNNPKASACIKDFCAFMLKEAYLRHEG